MPSVTLTPASFDSDYAAYSVSGTSQPVGHGSSSSSSYSTISLTRGSSAETYFYYNFDTSSIPDGATIISVECSAKIYISTTGSSYVKTRQAQLFSGNTAKGTPSNISNSTSAFEISAGSWAYDELKNLRLRCYAQRGSSRTTTNYYFRFYGAQVAIEYEENLIKHTITITTDDGIEIDKNATEEVREGSTFSISITGDVDKITDNGVDVTSELLEKTDPPTASVTGYPTSYTTSGSIRGTNYQSAIGKSSSNTASGNDYCNDNGSTATVYYSFDFSSIPENAIIVSVSVSVGGHCESTSNSSRAADLQLYSGDTAKGSKSSFTSTSKQIVEMTTGSWTRQELQTARLAFTIGYYGGLVNGADWTVVYTTPTSGGVYYVYTISNVTEDHIIIILADSSGDRTALYIKINGTYKNVKAIYKKINGSYVLVDETYVSADSKFVIK